MKLPANVGLCAGCAWLFAAAAADVAFAHRPLFTKDPATGPETAIQLADPQISQVVYRELTEKTPQVWLTFTVPENFELFFQIGVPVIERLKEFRPSVALIGPGLPQTELPFELPEGMGALVFATQDVNNPSFFHEHFTGTDSWILRSETVRLVKAGRYYLVAFSPQNQPGKLWVAVGTKESFTALDLLNFPSWRARVREFHEVSGRRQNR